MTQEASSSNPVVNTSPAPSSQWRVALARLNKAVTPIGTRDDPIDLEEASDGPDTAAQRDLNPGPSPSAPFRHCTPSQSQQCPIINVRTTIADLYCDGLSIVPSEASSRASSLEYFTAQSNAYDSSGSRVSSAPYSPRPGHSLQDSQSEATPPSGEGCTKRPRRRVREEREEPLLYTIQQLVLRSSAEWPVPGHFTRTITRSLDQLTEPPTMSEVESQPGDIHWHVHRDEHQYFVRQTNGTWREETNGAEHPVYRSRRLHHYNNTKGNKRSAGANWLISTSYQCALNRERVAKRKARGNRATDEG